MIYFVSGLSVLWWFAHQQGPADIEGELPAHCCRNARKTACSHQKQVSQPRKYQALRS